MSYKLYYIKTGNTNTLISIDNFFSNASVYSNLLNNPFGNRIGSTTRELLFSKNYRIEEKIIFTSIHLNDAFTCLRDEPFFAGSIYLDHGRDIKLTFCQTLSTNNPMWYNPNGYSDISKFYHGLIFNTTNSNINKVPYWDVQVINALNAAWVPNGNAYNFYIPDKFWVVLQSYAESKRCVDDLEYILGSICKGGGIFEFITSSFFYAKYISRDEVIATSVCGYVFRIIRDTSNFFYVNNVCLPFVLYNQFSSVYNAASDKCWRKFLPAFAIDSYNNEVYYSVSERIFRINNFQQCNISAIHIDVAQDDSILMPYKRHLMFITDMVVIPNGNKRDFITTHALLSHHTDLTISKSFYYKIIGYVVIHHKEVSNGVYKRIFIDGSIGNYATSNEMYQSEDFWKLKNVIRINKYDDTNYVVSILKITSVPVVHSYLHLIYDYNLQSVSIYKKEDINDPETVYSASVALLHPNIIIAPNVGNNEIVSSKVIDIGQYYSFSPVKTVPYNVSTGNLVVNDVRCADIVNSKYKLIKCNDSSVVIYPNVLSNIDDSMLGKVVNIYGHYDCCYYVTENTDCKSFNIVTEFVLVTNVYDSCNQCLGIELGGIKYELKHRTYRPALYTGACDPQEYIFNKCKFASAVYAKFLKHKFAINACCNENYDYFYVKNYLYDLLSQISDLCNIKRECNPVCLKRIRIERTTFNV